jgi:chitin disaccharide deacetylase
MKYLIVNADDFGASRGINRGVLALYQLGILTSASLMIDMPAAAEAVEMALKVPELGVGLHLTLTSEDATPLIDFNDRNQCAAEIEKQFQRFESALGRAPSHIDSHQNVHRDPRLTPLFIDFALRHGLPLREHSPARYLSSFYGQWDGETHPEQISLENLLQILQHELRDGFAELSCHPGWIDSSFQSSYHKEREIEFKTLSDARLRAFVREQRIILITFRDVSTAGTEP